MLLKYMGSKRKMLLNGLGEAIDSKINKSNRVLDLFSGSGAVAWHVGEKYKKIVVASDLQEYSRILAASVITRIEPITSEKWIKNWIERAQIQLEAQDIWKEVVELQEKLDAVSPLSAFVEAGKFSESFGDLPISRCYSGYYFSPSQALWLDCLRGTLPKEKNKRTIALASLIKAASLCAASPGHTAQPFKPNETAGRFMLEAWRRDLPAIVSLKAKEIGKKFSLVKGEAFCKDALEVAKDAKVGDLAFIDPPYSGVHYSRFYHVLETVARGFSGSVEGNGRYPPQVERPSSDYSLSTKSRAALDNLLEILAVRGANAIVTFPSGTSSNGMSGSIVKEIASNHFRIEEEKVTTRFSTMGGNTRHRAARHQTEELILKLSI